MASPKTLLFISTCCLATALSLATYAQTATKSPFASKKPKAWKVPVPTSPNSVYKSQPRTETPPQPQYRPQIQPQIQPQQQPQPQPWPPASAKYSYTQPQTAPAQPYQAQPYSAQPQQVAPTQRPGQPHWSQNPSLAGQPPITPQGYGVQKGYGTARPNTASQYNQNQYGQGQYNQGQYVQGQNPYPQNGLRGASAPTQAYAQNQYAQNQNIKPSWADRLGLGNVQTTIDGHAKIGVAAVDRTGRSVKAETIADFDIRAEASAITGGGLEYGAGVRVRAQRDRFRKGFGGRVGDCPTSDPACATTLVDGAVRTIKGHTGQFYTAGPADKEDAQIALEGAYVFMRTAYGDIVAGRDNGSAYLFSLGAPSLLAVNASNSPVDYTGFDSVKTYNDPSGFAEKIAYTTPRLLGDNVGVGVQFGASYAPNAWACGVDYCVKKNRTGLADPFAPVIEDIFEIGVALDRNFGNGFSAELTGTYARGSEASGNAAFDDLETFGAGLELKYGDFVFGSSYLNSNNGIAGNGDYTSYDAGLTWKPSNLGFTASYGHAKDEVAQLKSDQAVLGVSYDIGQFRLGTGVQYIKRKVPGVGTGGIERRKEEAGALFVELGVKF